jgi:threonyl-tRNA synthetase
LSSSQALGAILYERTYVTASFAHHIRARITALGEPYKLEILDSIKTEPITIYHVGDQWWDLCAGPHVESTGKLDARGIELQSLAGAYWRGDEKNAMLQVSKTRSCFATVATVALLSCQYDAMSLT